MLETVLRQSMLKITLSIASRISETMKNNISMAFIVRLKNIRSEDILHMILISVRKCAAENNLLRKNVYGSNLSNELLIIISLTSFGCTFSGGTLKTHLWSLDICLWS